jgi:tRNA-dihydrouridine synthase 1
VPVFANGNILTHADIARCLMETGADAVMSAEGQLYNVALFMPSQTPSTSGGLHPPHADLALEYLDIVSSLRTPTPPSGIKGHLFKLLRPALSRETDLRNALGELLTTKLFGR